MTMKIVVMTPTDLRDLQYFNIVLILKLDFFIFQIKRIKSLLNFKFYTQNGIITKSAKFRAWRRRFSLFGSPGSQGNPENPQRIGLSRNRSWKKSKTERRGEIRENSRKTRREKIGKSKIFRGGLTNWSSLLRKLRFAIWVLRVWENIDEEKMY